MPKPKDLMRGFLAIAALIAFQLALYRLFAFEVPEVNRDLVVFMLGQLSALAMAAYNYYFGTSKSSADKNGMMEDALSTPRPHYGEAEQCDCEADQGPRKYPKPEFGDE